jgi:DDE domain
MRSCPLPAVVSALLPQLSRLGRAHGGTKPERRPHHGLELGAALCSRTESASPAGVERTGTSGRVDETYVRVAGRWVYRFRTVDSGGARLDAFYLSESRDAAAAQRFFPKVLAANHPRPRVINVDGNPSYPKAVSRLKQERRLGRRCRCRTSPLPESYHRARPSSPQTTDQRQARVPIVRGSPTNHPGYEAVYT